MTDSAVKLVEDAYDVLLKNGNLDAFCEYFDDDTVLKEAESLPYGGTFKGRDAIKAAIQNVFGFYSSFGFEVVQITSGGDYVIAYGTFTATSAKNGKTVSFPLAEVWKIKDGKVLLLEPVYFDTKAVVDILAD